jgi:hypothetical protein
MGSSLDKRPFAIAECRVWHAPAGRMVAGAEPEYREMHLALMSHGVVPSLLARPGEQSEPLP